MKFMAAALAALTLASAPMSGTFAKLPEKADAFANLERPAVCEKAEDFKAAWSEKVANGELPQFEGDFDLSQFKPGAFTGKKFQGKKDGKPGFAGKFRFEDKEFSGNFEELKEKFADLTEEEKAALKENAPSFSFEGGFAGKGEGMKRFAPGRMNKAHPTFGENKQ